MPDKKINPAILHEIPKDLEQVLLADEQVLTKWNSLTDISRNEWICWVTIVKQDKTRQEHLERLAIELKEGKRRPCCWPGCPHHNPKAAKWFK